MSARISGSLRSAAGIAFSERSPRATRSSGEPSASILSWIVTSSRVIVTPSTRSAVAAALHRPAKPDRVAVAGGARESSRGPISTALRSLSCRWLPNCRLSRRNVCMRSYRSRRSAAARRGESGRSPERAAANPVAAVDDGSAHLLERRPAHRARARRARLACAPSRSTRTSPRRAPPRGPSVQSPRARRRTIRRRRRPP